MPLLFTCNKVMFSYVAAHMICGFYFCHDIKYEIKIKFNLWLKPPKNHYILGQKRNAAYKTYIVNGGISPEPLTNDLSQFER